MISEQPAFSWQERLRAWFWPRAGWKRVLPHIWKRLRRLKDTPHAIAAGFTSGIVVSFTPLLGLHVILACIIAWALRGNILAALAGTIAGNPLTFPIIWTLIYQIGTKLSGQEPPIAFDAHNIPTVDVLFEEPSWGVTDFFLTMMLGSAPICIALAATVYPATRWSVGVYQQQRKKRRQKRLRKEAL